MLERVLVPLDGSELSDRIVTQLHRLLVTRDAEVRLVEVVPEKAAREPARIDAARDHLARVAAPLQASGASVSTEVLVGEPAERIVEHANDWKPSLLALATHGRSGIARWIRGSTAERILRASPFPLFLANPHGLAERDELRIKKILVPLDGSEKSAEILPLVAEIAKLYEAQVTLFYVIELVVAEQPVAAILTKEEAFALLEPFRHRVGIQLREPQANAARVQNSGAAIKTTLGLPAYAIVDEAESGKHDLIALTTHGRSGLERWAFGSVAENVVRHAPCPLLVQRTARVTEESGS